ncbi:molybdopterin-dependent oxidoreductase, partial [Phascolarctobacterium faecium]
KFIRSVGKTNNVDHCARLCHASTVAGLAKSFGSGAMTNSIEEVDVMDVILVSGSNTTETHPVIGAKIKQRVQKGAALIVAEPRKIELAKYADVYLQIKPGTNVALFNGLMKAILDEHL